MRQRVKKIRHYRKTGFCVKGKVFMELTSGLVPEPLIHKRRGV